MRLRKKHETPIGGWTYTFQDASGNSYTVTAHSLRTLESQVAQTMRNNGLDVPGNLILWIEDQICARQPKGACLYDKSFGDKITKAIHTVAHLADTAAESVGLKPNLEKKARGCIGCHRRRMKLNAA